MGVRKCFLIFSFFLPLLYLYNCFFLSFVYRENIYLELDAYETHEWGWGVHGSRLSAVAVAGGFITGFSSFTGVGGASFRGGILSFIASSPFASANDVILWFGEKPWSAKIQSYFYYICIHIYIFCY